ncbi:MAG: energy transducer TonB [Bacteroidales bacterium]|nr:energy transducer TonB [Bacteroidales bacterium]
MKKLSILIILFLVVVRSYSQGNTENYMIGNYFDINSHLIDGFYDNSYNPNDAIQVSYNVGVKYTPGYYYDLDSNKVSGRMMYSKVNNEVKFKADANKWAKTLSPEDCISYVIATDSFAVIDYSHLGWKPGIFDSTNCVFLKVLGTCGNYALHQRESISNVAFYILDNTTGKYIDFPSKKKAFSKVAAKFFSKLDWLTDDIAEGLYKKEDIGELFQLLKYKRSLSEQEKIYYDAAWQEKDASKGSTYYGIIQSMNDSLYTQKYYFLDGTPVFEGSFSLTFPPKRSGIFNWYYPNGIMRKQIVYKNDNFQTERSFHEDGSLHYVYIIEDGVQIFDSVFTVDGIAILDKQGNGTEVFFDSIRGLQITYEYLNNKVLRTYYLDDDNRKIYQQCEVNAKIRKYKPLLMRVNKELLYPQSSLLNSNQGMVLVRCVVEPTGYLSKKEIIKGVDSACDSACMEFLTAFDTYRHWKPAKEGKQKVVQEVVVPLSFTIEGYFVSSWNYYDPWMRHQLQMDQMQQQMMRDAIPTRIPGHF